MIPTKQRLPDQVRDRLRFENYAYRNKLTRRYELYWNWSENIVHQLRSLILDGREIVSVSRE